MIKSSRDPSEFEALHQQYLMMVQLQAFPKATAQSQIEGAPPALPLERKEDISEGEKCKNIHLYFF